MRRRPVLACLTLSLSLPFTLALTGGFLSAASRSPRLGPLLAPLADAADEALASGRLLLGSRFPEELLPSELRDAASAGWLRLDKAGRVQVRLRLEAASGAGDDGRAERTTIGGGAIERTLAAVIELGGIVERRDDARGFVQARVPATSLRALSRIEGIRHVGLPPLAVAETGSRLTQGDTALRAAQARATWGLDGSGVRVGVISDGIFGLADAIASGDLPPTQFSRTAGKLVATSGGITSASFRADSDLEGALGSGRGAEGTAMLEIIHDLAPAAQLFFANFQTDLEFNAAVDWLAARTDVLVDDISFFGGPYDGTSVVSANAADALNDPANPLRAFFTSAGNRARDHWEEPYTASTLDGAPSVGASGRFALFQPTGRTDDAQGLGANPGNQIFLFRNQTVILILTWNDPPGASANDYDLYLFKNATGQLVGFSAAAQMGHEDPVEVLVLTNTGTQGLFDVRVQNYLDSAQPRDLEIFVVESPFRAIFPNGATLNYNTIEGSIPDMADAGGGVISVGAIDAADPGLDDIEGFSSQGPTNDGRLKPEIASVDRVSVTGSGGFPTTFAGTSAAAPHAAGVAALLLQQAPCLAGLPDEADAAAERAALREAILSRAIDLGPPGPDQTFGHGRNDAFDAGAAMLPAAEAGPAEYRNECDRREATAVTLDATGSAPFYTDCTLAYRWTGPFGERGDPRPTVTFPYGAHDVTLEVTQNGATWVADAQRVIIEDTIPPVADYRFFPEVLWPPNHRMVPIGFVAQQVGDACGHGVTLRMTDLISSEPDDAPGSGDGHTSGDMSFDPGTLVASLRAERDGSGPGRVYTLLWEAVDDAGNVTPLAPQIVVPQSLGAAPGGETLSLGFRDASTLEWSEVPWATGYRIARGPLDPEAVVASMNGSSVDLGSALSLVSGPAGIPRQFGDPAQPAPGEAFWYLAGYVDADGFTGFGSADAVKDRRISLP